MKKANNFQQGVALLLLEFFANFSLALLIKVLPLSTIRPMAQYLLLVYA